MMAIKLNRDIKKIIESRGWNVELAPETTGKNSQFGTVDELLELKNEIKCHITIDFAHILARDNKIDYGGLFKKIKEPQNVFALTILTVLLTTHIFTPFLNHPLGIGILIIAGLTVSIKYDKNK